MTSMAAVDRLNAGQIPWMVFDDIEPGFPFDCPECGSVCTARVGIIDRCLGCGMERIR